jgi:hypothetical protein
MQKIQSYKYFTEKQGKKFVARFILKNNTDSLE